MIDISAELEIIRSENDGETVIDAIISALDKLNTDSLLDLTSEKLVIKYSPIGKDIVSLKKGIARALYRLSQYSDIPPVQLLSQDQYDNIGQKEEHMLYLVHRSDKFMYFPLKPNGSIDFDKDCYYPIIDSLWDLPFAMRAVMNSSKAAYLSVIIGKDFHYATSIPVRQFEKTKIKNASIYLESYTIESQAFAFCEDLEEIYLGSGVTTIAEDAFVGCQNLKKIRIAKTADSVTGAPWGAINANVLWTR